MPDKDRCFGEVELDMVEEFNKSGWYIRVRCRKAWRVNASLLSAPGCVSPECGSGIRIVPHGQLVVPHHKLTSLIRESRHDIRRADAAQRLGE